ncbi:MAG: DUF3592 domain-containing protein [Opitutaceae bacterium]|jgi:hypothetical protein
MSPLFVKRETGGRSLKPAPAADGMPVMSETPVAVDEELVRFLAAPAPRVVPTTLRQAALRDSGSLLLALFGAIFLTMGLFFANAFLPWRQLDEWRLAASQPLSAQGRIISVDKTNMSINKAQVMRYGFKFQTARAETIRGDCFTTGRRWSEGSAVSVRYNPAEPALACPEGARLSQGGLGGAFVLIFPLVGGGIIFWVIRSRKRTVWLLQNGTLGDFRVTGIEATNVTINRQQQFKVTLQRIDQADGQPHEARWHKPALLAFARERQKNGQTVFGLFDPAKPKKVLMPEAWSARG